MWINDLKHDWILRRYLSDIDFAGGKLWNNNGVAFWEINHLEVIYHSRRSNINICPAKTALTLYRHFYTRRSTWCVSTKIHYSRQLFNDFDVGFDLMKVRTRFVWVPWVQSSKTNLTINLLWSKLRYNLLMIQSSNVFVIEISNDVFLC